MRACQDFLRHLYCRWSAPLKAIPQLLRPTHNNLPQLPRPSRKPLPRPMCRIRKCKLSSHHSPFPSPRLLHRPCTRLLHPYSRRTSSQHRSPSARAVYAALSRTGPGKVSPSREYGKQVLMRRQWPSGSANGDLIEGCESCRGVCYASCAAAQPSTQYALIQAQQRYP